MRPENCKNCCAREFIELDDAYVCAYCDTRYEKEPAVRVENMNYRPEPEPQPRYRPNTGNKKREKGKKEKNKWLAFLLCLFLGYYGVHKFYEGKIGMGLLYLFTGGLFTIGWFVDIFVLLFKPNPYYV